VSNIIIKTLHSNEEFEGVVELQKIVWKLSDYQDCVPPHLLLAVSISGGAVLGAYDNNILVGMGFLMTGYSQEEGLYYHSHFLGIHPDWQHKGVGLMLKKAQYEKAVSMGVKKITWTFDPLLGPNAQLNIRKLGAIVRQYKLNFYGETKSVNNPMVGIPSDRFWVEWLIDTPRVINRMNGTYVFKDISVLSARQVNTVRCDDSGFQQMQSFDKYPDENNIFIEIPEDFQKIFDKDIDRAIDWRLKTRELFQYYFKEGFAAVDFQTIQTIEGNKNIYLLSKTIE